MPRPDTRRFDELVRAHHAAVFRSARRICGCGEDAADVAQEVFLRVLRGKARLAEAGRAGASLCWLATRLARNHVRGRRRRTQNEDRAMQETVPTSVDPAHAAADADARAVVTELVGALPGELRLPLQLRCEDELTFAAIGSALSISESAAHERCDRALGKLRRWLRDRGFAAAALPIGELLAAGPAPAAPAGLEARLLELGSAPLSGVTAGLARRAALLVATATAAVAVTVASAMATGGDAPPVTVAAGPGFSAGSAEPGAAQDPPPVRRPVPVGPGATRAGAGRAASLSPQDPRPGDGVLTGTVHDAGGFAVVGARVGAVAGGGLKPFDLGSTVTGEGGSFRLRLEPGKLGGLARAVKIRVSEGPMLLLETADIALPSAADAEPLALVLPESVGTEATRFSLAVAVRGARGDPLAGVAVALYSAAGTRPAPGSRGEAEAVSDGNGIAVLTGRVVGDKWLFVDGRQAGHATSYSRIAIPGPGRHKTTVQLPHGRVLHGTVTAPGGESLARLSVWLEDPDGLRYSGEVQADGTLRFLGVRSVPHTLHARGWPWSPVAKSGLMPAPDGAPFAVELKRRDDPRDVGDHMAELHGRLVDAETGEEVRFGGFDVEVFRRSDAAGESTLVTDGCPPPPPVQRAAGSERLLDFHETGLGAGRWVLIARVPGYAATAREFTLRENEIRGDLRIPLARGANLHGRVVDDRGEPVPRARVFVVGVGDLADENLRHLDERRHGVGGAGSTRWPSVTLCGTRSGEDGTFALTGVPPGIALRLAARAPGHRLAIQAPNVHRAGAEVGGLELRLSRR